MQLQHQRQMTLSVLVMGILLGVLSLGGLGTVAYAQGEQGCTAPPCAVPGSEPSSGAGAEGETPGRRSAVAGEAGEAAGGVADTVRLPNLVIAADSGQGAADEPILVTRMPLSGAEGAFQWWLLVAGVALFATGSFLFMRARRLQ